jgi:hypothetical protein
LAIEAGSASGVAATYAAAVAVDAVTAEPSVAYSVDAGTTLGLGLHPITATGTDLAGNSASCAFNLTVRDTTAPALACPGTVSTSATGPEGAVVSFGPALVSDAVTPSPVVLYSRDSGTVFPLGSTTVTVSATDLAGNAAQCNFTAVVSDTAGPTLQCPPDVIVEAASAAGSVASYASATATDVVDPNLLLAYSVDAGTLFALGATPVTVTATDSAANSSQCSFNVTVRDTTPPSVTCPGAVVAPATGSAGATVSFGPAQATDAADAAPVLTYSRSSGSQFPLGESSVTVTATDSSGNQASCAFSVTVADATSPTLQCPSNETAEATSPAGAAAAYPAATASDEVDANPRVSYTQASGTVFALGETLVQVTATDSAGHSATCSFKVTVRDTTAPELLCPPDVVVGADDGSGATVECAPLSASDLADPSPVVTRDAPCGSTFPVGSTTVAVSATDTAGNFSRCNYVVTVSSAMPPRTTCAAVDLDRDGQPDLCPGLTTTVPPARPGCGCQGSFAGLVWWALPLALLWVTPRRRRGCRPG